MIDRKYVVTTLRKCRECNFQYRYPLDKPSFNETFYQDDYVQEGLTTDLPSAEELQKLVDSNFKNTAKDFSAHISLIKKMIGDKQNAKIIDYGANWGYTSLQFKKVGFDVQSFEISRPRANYGKKNLGIDIKTDERDLKPGNDVFFSSHVIEHHPKVGDMINLAKGLLKEDGIFIAYCPNGSKELREVNSWLFSQFWGLIHPNFLSADFYQFAFKNNPYLITSSPYNDELFDNWDKKSQVKSNLSGEELLVISFPNQNI